MFDATFLDVLDMDIERQFDLDPGAVLEVRAAAGVILATLPQPASGWDLKEPGDKTITVRLAEKVLPRTQLPKIAEFRYRRTATSDTEAFANGGRDEWKKASSQISTCAGWKAAYTIPATATGFPYTFDFALS